MDMVSSVMGDLGRDYVVVPQEVPVVTRLIGPPAPRVSRATSGTAPAPRATPRRPTEAAEHRRGCPLVR